ncbi:hypothetical protein TWF281_000636 [Arthrobotrys megalospora]
MKLPTILSLSLLTLTGTASARDRYGVSPENIIQTIQAEGEWARWPAVVHCTRGDVYGSNWEQTKAFVWRGPFKQDECKITWCDPDKGWCKFELKGDGGGYNWWQINWHRDGNSKKLCYPKPCNQM